MADIGKDLMQGYYDDIATEMQAGGTLDYIVSHEIIQSGNLTTFTSDYGTLPMILLEWGGHSLVPDSMEDSCRSDFKIYNINMYAFIEAYDENYGVMGLSNWSKKGTIDVAADLETLYNRFKFTFGVTDTRAIFTQVRPVTLALPKLLAGNQSYWFQGVQCAIEHTWVDARLTA